MFILIAANVLYNFYFMYHNCVNYKMCSLKWMQCGYIKTIIIKLYLIISMILAQPFGQMTSTQTTSDIAKFNMTSDKWENMVIVGQMYIQY